MSNFRIKVEVPSVEIAFEVGSISEAAGILTDNQNALANIAEMGANLANTYDPGDNGEETKQETKQETTTGNAPKPRRGRPPKANTTNAPAPVPVPAVSTPAPAPVAPVAAPAPVAPPVGDHGIPTELVRASQNPAPAPVPPPAPPAPTGLADRIVENLKSRFVSAPDGGAALTAWLKSLGLTKADATLDETYAVLRFTDQVRLESIAGALGVSVTA